MAALRIPLSTYRLQFHHQFTFKMALDLTSYFDRLGISDLYASPITKSKKGSMHGYDIIDSTQLNPEIGSEEDLEKLVGSLREKSMGLLLDIVPNHMWIAYANDWWNDILEKGPNSIYADFFNITWDSPEAKLKNKVLLPILAEPFGKVIENQEIKVIYEKGAFFLEYQTRRFPVNPKTWLLLLDPLALQLKNEEKGSDPAFMELESIMTAIGHLPEMTDTRPEMCRETFRETKILKKRLHKLVSSSPELEGLIHESIKQINGIKGDPESFNLLDKLVNSQAYRLSYWRVANEEINYRRFFDINELAALQIENTDVFQVAHELVFKYIRQSWATGLRIDHIDGIYDPQQYLEQLLKGCSDTSFYTIVEKILTGEEQLRLSWPVFGTTGYDFLNLLNNLFIVTGNKSQFHQIYQRFTNQNTSMKEVVIVSKRHILNHSMSSELHILAQQLEEIAEQNRWSRDFTFESLLNTLREIIACFPVYRSYIGENDADASEADQKYIREAVGEARKLIRDADPSIFDFIQNVLLLRHPEEISDEEKKFRHAFVMRLQQFTGPVMAKGAEDTAFYRYYPLASLNEVGMDFTHFGITAEYFHQKNLERMEFWSHTLLATSTHDSKRGEDVRARINVLSEMPEAWEQVLDRWSRLNDPIKPLAGDVKVPDKNEEYLIYQTLIGSWPFNHSPDGNYLNRINQYMMKALREAKIHTSWTDPNEEYEKGIFTFIEKILKEDLNPEFVIDFRKFIQPLIKAGIYNALSQLILKMTAPGVPDLYQGNELWTLTLVDPDNRHNVDFNDRLAGLETLEKAQHEPARLVAHLMETPENGLIKMYLTMRILNFRKRDPLLFQEGDYIPLLAEGRHADHVVAFCRKTPSHHAIIVTGRFFSILSQDKPPIGEVWTGTYLQLPNGLEGNYQDLLTGQTFQSQGRKLDLSLIFTHLPFVVLHFIT